MEIFRGYTPASFLLERNLNVSVILCYNEQKRFYFVPCRMPPVAVAADEIFFGDWDKNVFGLTACKEGSDQYLHAWRDFAETLQFGTFTFPDKGYL